MFDINLHQLFGTNLFRFFRKALSFQLFPKPGTVTRRLSEKKSTVFSG